MGLKTNSLSLSVSPHVSHIVDFSFLVVINQKLTTTNIKKIFLITNNIGLLTDIINYRSIR